MKTHETWKITALRVVEFHNLGTTTIKIPDGGHLFLLGDNGSGKTTILDAIHLVLSAGREMEFNAAARVAGAKDSGGRTFQGIVLRYNAVTGRTMRETGVTYAALEFQSETTGKAISFALGISALGMDVAYERWGAFAPCTVDELPLVVEAEGRMRPATQGEFKERVGALLGGRYFSHVSDYARAVGERLFGGEAKYLDVCKLLRTGKAYREIATKAANYNELFRQLLEEPSRDTFEPLLKGLRELDSTKGTFDQIEERVKYLSGLKRERDKRSGLRLERDALAWHEADVRLREGEERRKNLETEEAEGRREAQALVAQANEKREAISRERSRLEELKAKDSSGLTRREKEAVEREAAASRRAGDAERALGESECALKAAQKELDCMSAARRDELGKAAGNIARFAKSCALSAGSLVDALYVGAAEPQFAPVKTAADQIREQRSKDAHAAFDTANAAEAHAAQIQAELDALRNRGDVLPDVTGFAALRDATKSGLFRRVPQCVYELLEPASGCDAKSLAYLERLAGDEFLATWLVEPDDADAMRRLAFLSSQPYASIAVRGSFDDVSVDSLAPWLGKYVSFDQSDLDAVKLLALHLASKSAPEKDRFLEVDTMAFRRCENVLADARPRLVGKKFRAAELARQMRELEARIADAVKSAKAAQKNANEAKQAADDSKRLYECIASTESLVFEWNNKVLTARTEVRIVTERREMASKDAAAKRLELEEARTVLEDIRLKMRAAGIDASLEKRIESAQKAVERSERDFEALQQCCGVVQARLEGLARQIEGVAAGIADAANEAASIRAKMGEVCADLPFAEFIEKTRRAYLAPGTDAAAAHEDIVARTSAAETNIERDIRAPQGQAYLFVFDKEANTLCDRRGVELAAILAEESRRLDELREVIDNKTRDVFERIFMGEIMQRLREDQMHIEQLAQRIRQKLADRKFGSNRYQFSIAPEAEYEAFISLVKRGDALGAGGEKDELRECLLQHRDEILNADIDSVPAIFDYRNWYRFELKVLAENEEGRVIDRRVKSMGSGGEQAVPNYLLILTVADFLYHGGDPASQPKTAPLLFDEAFYGIDSARRDQILAFAESLGLQLFVSSPDQDGVKKEIKNSVSLIVVKDSNLDVHLSPVVWNNTPKQESFL